MADPRTIGKWVGRRDRTRLPSNEIASRAEPHGEYFLKPEWFVRPELLA